MDKQYWLQAMVAWDRNMDFINDLNNRQINVRAINYNDGSYQYIISSESQDDLTQVMLDYQTEDYQFESSNLDPEHQYPEGN